MVFQYQFLKLYYCSQEVENKNETDDLHDSDGIDEEIVGAVGGISIRCISSEEADSCPITRLNDDCLELIFSKLSLFTQIQISKGIIQCYAN